MTKPDDIPQGVWGDAMEVENDVNDALALSLEAKAPSMSAYEAHLEVIARAIMAAKAEEREACANIADSKISGGYYDGAPVWADGNEIACAIRKRGEEE